MVVLSAPNAAEANQEKVLYSFTGGTDGDGPGGDLITDGRGNYYGTTGAGGGSSNCTNGCGTVFKIANGQVSVLYAFAGESDGSGPTPGLLVDDAGNLYGTTGGGGANGFGTVFKITRGGIKSVLYSFAGGSDGASPNGQLIADAEGNLYGTTYLGGLASCGSAGCGTAFKVTPDGQETVLYAFSPVTGNYPAAGLIADAQGDLYGTNSGGGTGDPETCGPLGCGTVFKLTPDGQETVLYNFYSLLGGDGYHPFCRLTADAEGNLYGTTFDGGTRNGGAVFKLTPEGAESLLYSFRGGSDAAAPRAGLIADTQGNLYGTTMNSGVNNNGTVYKVTLDGRETVLYSFGPYSSGDGYWPSGRLSIDAKGTLYGATSNGGASGKGTIFKVQN